MKIFCQNINETPDKSELISLTENEYLRLEFPTKILENDENKVLDILKSQLADCSVFVGGRSDETITITIIPVVSAYLIRKHFKLIIKALVDYIDISNTLVENVPDESDWNDWELTYEHFPHNRYENKTTGQIVETCAYKMSSFKEIDSEFFGIFIESSTQYLELIEIIKDTYHNTARILDTVNTCCMDSDDLETFFIKIEENHKIEKELFELLLSYDKQDDFYKFIDVVILLNKEGISKKILIDILHRILDKLEDSQIVQEDIVGDILDYIIAWATPPENTKRYKLFIHFNPDMVE